MVTAFKLLIYWSVREATAFVYSTLYGTNVLFISLKCIFNTPSTRCFTYKSIFVVFKTSLLLAVVELIYETSFFLALRNGGNWPYFSVFVVFHSHVHGFRFMFFMFYNICVFCSYSAQLYLGNLKIVFSFIKFIRVAVNLSNLLPII